MLNSLGSEEDRRRTHETDGSAVLGRRRAGLLRSLEDREAEPKEVASSFAAAGVNAR